MKKLLPFIFILALLVALGIISYQVLTPESAEINIIHPAEEPIVLIDSSHEIGK